MGEVVAFVFGLLVGSFLNATVWRVRGRRAPSTAGVGGSIWFDRSACPRCGHGLAARDLVPVLSWLLLLGRCRYCSQPISVRYPMSELATAGVFSLAYAAL